MSVYSIKEIYVNVNSNSVEEVGTMSNPYINIYNAMDSVGSSSGDYIIYISAGNYTINTSIVINISNINITLVRADSINTYV